MLRCLVMTPVSWSIVLSSLIAHEASAQSESSPEKVTVQQAPRNPSRGSSEKDKIENERAAWMLYGQYSDEIDAGERVTLTGDYIQRSKGITPLLRIGIGKRFAYVNYGHEVDLNEVWHAEQLIEKKDERTPHIQIKMEGVLAYNPVTRRFEFQSGVPVKTGPDIFDIHYPSAAKVVAWRFGYSSKDSSEEVLWGEWLKPDTVRARLRALREKNSGDFPSGFDLPILFPENPVELITPSEL